VCVCLWQHLMVAGGLTDQCVESAVRDACDLGYLVTLVPDACVTHSQPRHDNSLQAVRGYCRQRTTAVLAAEIEAGAAVPSEVGAGGRVRAARGSLT